MVVLKFFLNVSREEQHRRFLARLEEPDKNWKFNERDVRESEHWDDYMKAYDHALSVTSRPWAPWYIIPADDKPFAHLCVAGIVTQALLSLHLRYPEPQRAIAARFGELRSLLETPKPRKKTAKRKTKQKK
jgi:polyphosphate kinase 2 (PPK2 family)